MIALCEESELSDGQMRRFELEGFDPLLLCKIDGTFQLIDDECTHAIASLSEGRLDGTTLFCPMHGGSFDVCSGKARSLPCKQPLRTYEVRIDDGMVYVVD